jgi:hypothetical protein
MYLLVGDELARRQNHTPNERTSNIEASEYAVITYIEKKRDYFINFLPVCFKVVLQHSTIIKY